LTIRAGRCGTNRKVRSAQSLRQKFCFASDIYFEWIESNKGLFWDASQVKADARWLCARSIFDVGWQPTPIGNSLSDKSRYTGLITFREHDYIVEM
jgi:hypothetical protein